MASNLFNMTTPYIGSKISLISQLDIRYEGFLHKVDPVESTISLSRVRSFGTEDRLANVIVPARKEVYDYIIFKASDIKDLIVCDTPKPTPDIDDITYDPAIISVSKPPLVMPSSTEERKATQDSGASSLKANKFGAQFESRQQQRDATTNEQLSGRFGQSVRHQFYQQGAVQGQRQPHKYINVRQAPRVFQAQDHQISYQQQQHSYNGDHRPHHQHYYYNQARNTRKYDGDFDFEKANEDFLESVDGVIDNIAELDLEHSDFHSPPKDKSPTQEIDGEINDDKVIAVLEKSTKNDIYYDKSRSFFDNISCEATEREAGKDNRIDWKKERLTNEVTFGPAAVRMHNFHRRGSRGGAAPHLRRVGYFNNQQQRRYGAGPPANISGGVFERQSTKQNK